MDNFAPFAFNLWPFTLTHKSGYDPTIHLPQPIESLQPGHHDLIGLAGAFVYIHFDIIVREAAPLLVIAIVFK